MVNLAELDDEGQAAGLLAVGELKLTRPGRIMVAHVDKAKYDQTKIEEAQDEHKMWILYKERPKAKVVEPVAEDPVGV
jgi:hypothetical protein